jgi:hypothetical protein
LVVLTSAVGLRRADRATKLINNFHLQIGFHPARIKPSKSLGNYPLSPGLTIDVVGGMW